MLDTCTQQNTKDFIQRYKGTIGSLVKENGEKQWVWIASVGDGGVVFTDTEGIKYTASLDKEVLFEFTQVPMGWYNTSEGPLFFTRRPARQWQRGISSGNTRLYNENLESVEVTLGRVASAFSFTERYKNHDAWALSKHFAFNRSGTLYFYDLPMGKRNGTQIVVNKGCLVMQEIQDILNRTGLPFTLVMES